MVWGYLLCSSRSLIQASKWKRQRRNIYTDTLRKLNTKRKLKFFYWWYMSWAKMDRPRRQLGSCRNVKAEAMDQPLIPNVLPLLDLLT